MKNGKFANNKKFKDQKYNKPRRGGKKPDPVDHVEMGSEKHNNDWKWYAKSEQLLTDAASLAYGRPVGSGFSLDERGFGEGGNFVPYYHRGMPGVLTAEVVLTPGVSRDLSSPVNIASRKIYSDVRHANSGSANYDSPDLMLYLMTMGNAYAYYAYLFRIYGLARSYNAQNRYQPRTLLIANHVDPDDICANLANLRSAINVFRAKLSAFYVPDIMSLYQRYMFMFQDVYKDQDSAKAQYFMYVPFGFHYFEGYTDKTGGKLTFERFQRRDHNSNLNNLLKTQDLINFMNKITGPITDETDWNIMSGDILKAYKDNVWHLSELTDDYIVTPIYDAKVLSQFQNSYCLKFDSQGEDTIVWPDFDIGQDPDNDNIITFDPAPSGGMNFSHDLILTLNTETPSPADSMVATRLTTAAVFDGSELEIKSIGTELLVEYGLYYNSDVPLAHAYDYDDYGHAVFFTSDLTGYYDERALTQMAIMAMLSNFTGAPTLYIAQEYGEPSIIGIHGDIDNFVVVDANTLGKMHTVATLSEFNV